MTTRPHPGTAAYNDPEPELVTEILGLVSKGTTRQDAMAMVEAKDPGRAEVEAARGYWIRQMPRFDWDDYTGTRVLMILENVLRKIPREQ